MSGGASVSHTSARANDKAWITYVRLDPRSPKATGSVGAAWWRIPRRQSISTRCGETCPHRLIPRPSTRHHAKLLATKLADQSGSLHGHRHWGKRQAIPESGAALDCSVRGTKQAWSNRWSAGCSEALPRSALEVMKITFALMNPSQLGLITRELKSRKMIHR